MTEGLTDKQLEILANALHTSNIKPKKKKTKTSKKAFWAFMSWCLLVQILTGYMAWRLNSEMLLAIFATEAVLGPVFTYKFYLEYNREINLKHMEQNYQVDYDSTHGIK